MTKYVMGFMFDQRTNEVVLIRKNRPAWQAGKLNGVGGHIEEGETPSECMSREFLEETGVKIEPEQWAQFAVMFDPAFEVYCFYAHGDSWLCRTTTDEEVVLRQRKDVLGPAQECIDSIPWLMVMAESFMSSDPGCTHYRIEYMREQHGC